MVELKTKAIEEAHTVNYMNNMYQMKETLSTFEQRKITLEPKLTALNASVDKKISFNKAKMADNVEDQRKNFEKLARQNVDSDVKDLKLMGEYEYNFDQLIKGIKTERSSDFDTLTKLIDLTVNDEFLVCQKEEATRKLLLSQVNFLKSRIKMEIESRR